MTLHRRTQALLALIAAGVLLPACTSSAQSSPPAAQVERGARIFRGDEVVKAQLSGHDVALPAQMGKCINCHTDARRPDGEQSAPLLTRAWLTQPHPRRGGPAFGYDQQGFCRTVRTGIDPEHVILLRAMPRFDLSDDQCMALWAYLTSK